MVFCQQNSTHPTGAYLLRWDWQNGGQQELIGLLGTPDTVCNLISDLRIDRERDILYAVCSSGKTPPLICIDLAAQRRNTGTMGPAHNVDQYYPHPVDPKPSDAPTMPGGTRGYEGASFENNHEAFPTRKVFQLRIWTHLKDDQENSAIIGLYWLNNTTIRGVCGASEPKYGFEIHCQKVVSLIPLADMDEETQQEYLTRSIPVIADPGIKLPHVAGRQYLAVPSAAAQ